VTGLLLAMVCAAGAAAQEPVPPDTRAGVIAQAQTEKAAATRPFEPGRIEAALNRVEELLVTGKIHLHPFFDSAYAGGGFTLGAGYARHVSAFNVFDVRGSITFSGYKRIEAGFLAPRLFDRRATLSAVGGWREATAVGFYGIGSANTSKADRKNYSFQQPYAAATIDFLPVRKLLVLTGGVEVSQWDQDGAKHGNDGSVDDVYTPETLPGLGSSPAYLHTSAGIGRPARLEHAIG